AGRSAVGAASHRAARTHSVRHAEIDSRWRLLSGYDDPRAIGSASAESVFAMQTNARTLHGSERAVAPTCTSPSEAAPARRAKPRGEGAHAHELRGAIGGDPRVVHALLRRRLCRRVERPEALQANPTRGGFSAAEPSRVSALADPRRGMRLRAARGRAQPAGLPRGR